MLRRPRTSHRRGRRDGGGDRPAPEVASPSRRSANTGRCVRSTPAPTCTSTTSATSRWVPRRRSWCGASMTPGRRRHHPPHRLHPAPRRHARAGPDPWTRNRWPMPRNAEHLMLIDLARQRPGPHRPDRQREGHRGLRHRALLARDAHRLQRGRPAQGGLPAWTCCGPPSRPARSAAPKIRAMEIIDELEPSSAHLRRRRGLPRHAGDMDVAIAIRTGIIQNNTLYVQAAAGVVADRCRDGVERDRGEGPRALACGRTGGGGLLSRPSRNIPQRGDIPCC